MRKREGRAARAKRKITKEFVADHRKDPRIDPVQTATEFFETYFPDDYTPRQLMAYARELILVSEEMPNHPNFFTMLRAGSDREAAAKTKDLVAQGVDPQRIELAVLGMAGYDDAIGVNRAAAVLDALPRRRR